MDRLVKEIMYMFPDSILFGSFLMSISTLSGPHTIFFISILFSLCVLYFLQNSISFIFGGKFSEMKCKSNLYKFTFEQLFIKPSAYNPSYSMFLVSFACTYLAVSNFMLKEELDVLDMSFVKKYYLSISLLMAFVLLYFIFHLMNDCDTMGSSTMGLVFGSLTGLLMVNIVVQLYGKEGVNFVGIPLLRNKTADGKPIYICSK